MNESQATTKFKNALKPYGVFWKASDRYVSGIPDIIGCVNGNFVCIEMKIDYGKPTPLQVFFMDAIEQNDGYAIVVRYHNKEKLWEVQDGVFHDKIDDAVQYIIQRI